VILSEYSVPEILHGLDSLSDPVLLEQLKATAASAGKQEYNWSRAQEVLLGAYGRLIPQEPNDTHASLPEVAAR